MVQCTASQRVLTGKYTKKAKYQNVGSMMNQKLKLHDPYKDDGDKFGKVFFLSIIHTRLNKCLSNEAILENYGTVMRGMKEYHKFVSTTATSSLSNVTLAPPVGEAVNKKNIDLMEKSILTAYRSDNDSLYKQMEKSKFLGLMYDGISKFSHEFNGVYLRRVDDNFAPFNIPFSLKNLSGGVNAYNIVKALFIEMSEFLNIENSAYENVKKHIDCNEPPPNFFKLGTLLEVKEN